MEDDFLYRVAKLYVSLKGSDIQNCCFVFPNRRSSVFFRKYVGLCSKSALFSPSLYTINDLFSSLSGYRNADKIELLFLLYRQYEKLSKNIDLKADTFDDFVYWGEMILSDFNDIDKYRVDADKLFTNIKDLRELDEGYDFLSRVQKDAIIRFWDSFDFKNEDKSRKKKLFRETWSLLASLYASFRADLKEKNLAYEGMVYRDVADILDSGNIDSDPNSLQHREKMLSILKRYETIVFVGQNALSECEKALCNVVKNELDGDFYWDYYGRMVTDEKNNKSSLFIKHYVKDYPSKYQLYDQTPSSKDTGLFDNGQNIEVISVPSAVGQTKKVSEILSSIEGDSVRTVVVLPDETLLIPLLNTIPEKIKDVNVTMGYSISNSSLASFMNMVESLQRNKRKKINISGENEECFYNKDVLSLLSHPFIRLICSEEASRLINQINSTNSVYVFKSDVVSSDAVHPLLDLILTPVESVEAACSYELRLLESIAPHISSIEREFAYGYFKAVCKMRDLKIEMSPDMFYRFMKRMTSVISIPFRGEPLAGLQIMGPLETRALDFDNVIILSVNEGTFPAGNVSNSFIPYNLRKGFGLPTFEYLDSISAYHFYRSIYRAKNVYLLYDSRTAGVAAGQVSRYVKQLKYHYGRDRDIKMNFIEKSCSYRVNIVSGNNGRQVIKSPEIIDKLGQLLYSASSLNCFMNCPFKFYYENVEKLKESDEVAEDVDASLYGTIFHRVIQKIYAPFTGREINVADIDGMLADMAHITALVNNEIREQMFLKGEPEGKYLIVTRTLIEFVTETLKADRTLTQFKYEDSEKKLFMKISVCSGNTEQSRELSFIGFIDRIDRQSGAFRISDYKTGGGKEIDVDMFNIWRLFDTSRSDRPAVSFQMMLYALLSRKNGLCNGDISYSVYKMKDIFGNAPKIAVFPVELIEAFEERLIELMREIMDPDTPFVPTPGDGRKCEYCKLRSLCGN